MEVRLLINTKWGKSFVRAGDIIDVDAKTAKDLIARKVAEEATESEAPADKSKASSETVEVVNENKSKGAGK